MGTVLVTGAGGRLGRKLVKKLLGLGESVIAVTSNPFFLTDRNLSYIKVDWAEFELPEFQRVDCVVHLAHQTSAYKARESVSSEVQENLLVLIKLIEKLKPSGPIPKFIYLGSLTEYGAEVVNPIVESSPLKPSTFYDAGKIAAEIYLEQFFNEGWVEHLNVFRLGNVYGMGTSNQGRHRGFLDNSIESGAKGLPLSCFGSGGYLRDFIHVGDVIDVLVKAATETPKSHFEILRCNLASGVGTTILGALQTINRALVDLGQQEVGIEFIDFPLNSYPIEKRSHVADISEIMNRFNWVPKFTLYQGIKSSLGEAIGALDGE